MNGKLKFALLLAGLYLLSLVPIATVGALFWADLDGVERQSFLVIVERRASLFALAALTMLGVVAVLLRTFYAKYVTPPLRLAEGTRIILGANPAHRVTPEGGEEPQALAQVINAFASQHQALLRDVDARVREAQARVAEERNRLAALVSELTQGVLVCNAEGRILLFNARARELLGQPSERPHAIGGASLVGLGRSVFAIFERSLVAHAVETVEARLRGGGAAAVAHFAANAGEHLVHVQVTPVLAAGEAADAGSLAGFILLVDDVTAAADRESRRAGIFLGFADASRRALASIRAAVEAFLAYPQMDAARRARFAAVIEEEATALSARLEQAEGEYRSTERPTWMLQSVSGADLAGAVVRRVETRLGLAVRLEPVDEGVWLRADAFSLMQALCAIAAWLHLEAGVTEIRLRVRGAVRLAQLDLAWSGAALDPEALTAWEDRPLATAGEPSPLTLKQVVELHEGELWHQTDRAAGTGLFRFVLPLAQPEVAAPRPAVPVERSRPEFFDFDLFAQGALDPELERRRLSDLTFTVFDTETTGLAPELDEIVCIGAIRIVNLRVLHQDSFEQFVDPGRPMSPEAARITGIDASMLRGQPPIAQVLPQFHRYCEETVLVAHNAAFDMRFLQLLEPRTGVRFTQPVLDTLLLSAVLHPNLAAHRFEEIAARFGVPVIGRHTALGDAIMAGEIFLKMIPLLADAGIVTLKDAREASQRTWQARIRY
ncbi:MAG TPA: exonuclease domain-containing protein [Anaeromyxobacteraceae bacterium]|nr:exonuclease domain-containing protein [Anaeromyxobacteraceae bacterium]